MKEILFYRINGGWMGVTNEPKKEPYEIELRWWKKLKTAAMYANRRGYDVYVEEKIHYPRKYDPDMVEFFPHRTSWPESRP
jgi:hypothetical protein